MKFSSHHPRLLACLLCLCACGCARGCQSPDAPLPPPASTLEPALPPADGSPAAIEQHLHVVLAQRTSSDVLPAMAMLPYRRLAGFDPTRQLIATLNRDGLRMFERTLEPAKLSDEAAMTELLRWGMAQWATRSGTAANRLYLALDASTQVADAARVRRIAMAANTWKVVALARDGEKLVELLLDPPTPRVPNP